MGLPISLVSDFEVTLKPWLATRKMRSPSSSTTCPSSPRWRPWLRPAAICFNSSKATRRKPQEAFSSAYPGNKLRLTAKTLKSKKVTKLGLSVLWKRDNALRVSLTNLELLKSLLRRRRVNFGKERSFFWPFFLNRKIQSPPTQKKNVSQ